MRILKTCSVTFILVMFTLAPVLAVESDLGEQDTQAVQTVIQGQLDAFRADDEDKAWTFAAPHIHAMFKTPANFMDMVVSTYTIVYRHEKAHFLDLKIIGNAVVQKVLFVAEDGKQAYGLYNMVQTPDGRWLIAGCVLAGMQGEAT